MIFIYKEERSKGCRKAALFVESNGPKKVRGGLVDKSAKSGYTFEKRAENKEEEARTTMAKAAKENKGRPSVPSGARPLSQKIRARMEQDAMAAPGDRVVVGFSGGPDSTALLHWLATERPDLTLFPVHIHHGLRPEADAEAEAAVRFCRSQGLSCRVVRGDARREAERRGLGVEEAARSLRYRALETVLAETKAHRLALAHTQNDQAETLLLWLCRGTGLRGLTGIPPVRGRIIRPLLDGSRDEVLAYCAAYGLPFSRDESNESPAYTRNRVRQLLPLLEARINPQTTAHLAQTAALLREEDACLDELASQALTEGGLSRENLLARPLALRRRMVRLAWLQATGSGKDLSAAHTAGVLALLEKQPGRRVDLPGGFVAEGGFARLTLRKKEEAAEFCFAVREEVPQTLPGLGDWVLFTKKTQKIQENGYTLVLDYDTIAGYLECRNWRPGDRLLWPGHNKSVKELFLEKKVPRFWRGDWPLFVSRGWVVFVPGLWASPAVRPGPDTKQTAQLFIGGGKTFERASSYVYYKGRN